MSAISIDDGSSTGFTKLFDIRISIDESALANPKLAKRLIEATLLLTDRERRKSRMVSEIFSSFYPTILNVNRYFTFQLSFNLNF